MKDEIKLAWAAFVVACIALCFLVIKDIVLPRYPENYGNYTTEEYQEISLTLSKRDLIAQWVMALGTLALFGLTLLSVRHANRTSEQALAEAKAASAETKRSVDAFINAERGRLVLDVAYRTAGGRYQVLFWFINAGASQLNVTGFGYSMQTLKNLSDTPKSPTVKAAICQRIVRVNEPFGSDFGYRKGGGYHALQIPAELIDPLKAGEHLCCSFLFQYSTSFGMHEALFSYHIPKGPDDIAFAYYGKGIWYDRLLGTAD